MKKLVLTLAIVLLSLNFGFAHNGNPKKDVIRKSADGIEIAVLTLDSQKAENDALHCTVHCKNGNTYSCWLCNCSELPSCDGGAQQK